MYIAENLKTLRKEKNLTQEEVAEALSVSPQSVSKWERGDSYPDITLLPALANFYETSIDKLIGMNKINDEQTKNAVFIAAQKHWRNGDLKTAIDVYSKALKTFPNDKSITSELAMALAFEGGADNLNQAITLCERVLSDNSVSEKVHHTTRAASCFIYFKAGFKEKAINIAKSLPHIRESREIILKQIESEINLEYIDAYLRFIALGESNQQDVLIIEFGVNMIPICSDFNLTGKIGELREEIGAPHTNDGLRKLPLIRIRDNVSLAPNQVRVFHYSDLLFDREFKNGDEAVNEIMATLRRIT